MLPVTRTLATAMACALLWLPAAEAQNRPSGGSRPGGPGAAQRRPPKPPVETVLDANGDEVFDASELAAASTTLGSLDADGDGRLSIDECLPPRPDQGGETAPRQGAGARPLPPVLAALDSNDDGEVSANELAASASTLLSLDANGDGQLSPSEYRPQHQGRPGQGRNGPQS